MLLERMHNRQLGGAGVTEQVRDALCFSRARKAERPVMRFMGRDPGVTCATWQAESGAMGNIMPNNGRQTNAFLAGALCA